MVQQESLRSSAEVHDTVFVREVVFAADTVREVTVVTVQLNADKDTVFRSEVTDRERLRERVADVAVREKVIVKVDTVYVERDSVFKAVSVRPGARVDADGTVSAGGSRFVAGLRWVFFIILAIVVLVVLLKFGRKGILW